MKSYKDIFAILVSAIIFGVAQYNLTNYTNTLAQDLAALNEWKNWLIVIAYSLYFISGFISAILSKQNPLVVSALTGLVCAVLAIVFFGVGGDLIGLILMLTLGSFTGMLGGLVVLMLNKLKSSNKALKQQREKASRPLA